MENASKALVIAGAILISILIIGLGVFIYNGAASTITKANLNSQEAQAQNQQFEAYFGDKKSAAEVKQLISLIRSNNITSDTGEESKKIAVFYQGGTGSYKTSWTRVDLNAITANVISGRTYHVGVANDKANDNDPTGNNASADAYYKSGFIRVISIVQNGTDGSVTAFPNGSKEE